jgi:hypothetical protein
MSLNIIYNWVVKTISQQNYCWSFGLYGNSNEMPFINNSLTEELVLGLFADRLVQGYDGDINSNSFLADQSGDKTRIQYTEQRFMI